jgi:ribosomal protein S21
VKVAVQNRDLLGAMRQLKRKLRLDNEEHLSKLRAIPKPSERRKAKERTAKARLRNQKQREGSRYGR